MPITLPPISRRKFLATTLLGAAGLALPRPLRALGAEPDLNHFILISDTHLAADKNYVHDVNGLGATNPWKNFGQVCGEAMALPQRPATVLVNGDVACREGLTEDYATAVEAMKPLREAGLTVHWSLGNHDDRAHVSSVAADDSLMSVTGKRVMMLQMPRANFFILDSLNATNNTPGLLGDAQLTWLAGALDKYDERPAMVFVHHQPYLRKPGMGDGTHLDDYEHSQKSLEDPATDQADASGKKPANDALLDTIPLLKTLLPRKHVKAYFFGHTHEYTHKVIEGMHLVNLPSTAWIFTKGQPLGWMDMHVEERGAKLQLHCLDPEHPLHHDKLDLQWRA